VSAPLPPKHVAIIMDGNGRWAQSRHHRRIYGHIRGASVAKAIIEHAAGRGISHLTLFAFSTENWLRPKDEVSFLMALMARRLRRECHSLVRNNIRFECIGEFFRLPGLVREQILATKAATSGCTGMTLTFAVSYGGRQELIDGFRGLARKIAAGQLSPEDIDEKTISNALESSFLPTPDLIIRTSGENRLSNFFLWQAAYSEFYFCPEPWPEFSPASFDAAVASYVSRDRRYGRVAEPPGLSMVPPA
jgi:undecaprenyl diphosphate synthase